MSVGNWSSREPRQLSRFAQSLGKEGAEPGLRGRKMLETLPQAAHEEGSAGWAQSQGHSVSPLWLFLTVCCLWFHFRIHSTRSAPFV